MAEYLTKDFVDLSDRRFRPHKVAKLSFYHRERGLYVRPLVVMLHKDFPVEAVEMPHSVPQAIISCRGTSHSPGIALEGNITRATRSLDCVKITTAGISSVRRHLVDSECLGGFFQQGYKLNCVTRFIGRSLDTGDDVSLDSAHQMGFYPCLPAALAVFMVEPSGVCLAGVCLGGEARGINGEVGLDGFQWAGALLYEALEQWRQFWILQIAERAVVMGSFGNQTRFLSLFQLSGTSSSRHCCVGLEHESEYDISQWQAGTTEPVFWLLDAVAQVAEQNYKTLLFVGLSAVIGSPVLGVGHLHRLGHNLGAIGALFPLLNELDCVNVLALLMGSFKMLAGAKRLIIVKINDVSAVARLGRDLPAQFVSLDRVAFRYRQSSFLPNIHFPSPYQLILFYIYNSIQCMDLSIPLRLIFWENFLPKPIDNSIRCMVLYIVMNANVQTKLVELQEKGWTLAALADELDVTPNAVEKWKSGDRYPSNTKAVLILLDQLAKRKRIPKKKRYAKGSRKSIPK